jgi:hypothetical protein
MNVSDRPARQERRRCVTPCFGSGRHEDAVCHAGVEMHVVVERRTEAVADETPPSLGREALGGLAAAVTPQAVIRVHSISSRKILVTAATARGRSARKPRSRFGTEITHCRTGTGGMT